MFGHGCGGPPHRSDSLLHGKVNNDSRTTERNPDPGLVVSSSLWRRYEYGTLSQDFQNGTLNNAACVANAASYMDTESVDKTAGESLEFQA